MNASVSAVLRGNAAVVEVRDLLDSLTAANNCLAVAQDAADADYQVQGIGNIHLSRAEVEGVISRRRDAIILRLENKGLRIAPEPEATP